jgi:hypothetical protein
MGFKVATREGVRFVLVHEDVVRSSGSGGQGRMLALNALDGMVVTQ